MAASPDVETRQQVVAAMQNAPDFRHPEMRFIGMEILAALPPSEAAPFATAVANWLDRDVRNMLMPAPERLLTSLAEEGETGAALIVARALLQILKEDGNISTLYMDRMYEYRLPKLMTMLTRTCGLDALTLFIELLRDAAIATGKLVEKSFDHSHISLGPIASDEFSTHSPYSALIRAVRNCAKLLAQSNPSSMRTIVALLTEASINICERIAIYVLAENPAAAPEFAQAWLTDSQLIEAPLYKEEYAALALAWLPSLPLNAQDEIFNLVWEILDRCRDEWEAPIEQQGNSVSTEDRHIPNAMVIDALWHWRTILPTALQKALNETIQKYGGPYVKRSGPMTYRAESPLQASDFSIRSMAEIVSYFKAWHQGNEKLWETTLALARQWRAAVGQDPDRYAAAANQLVGVSLIYADQLFQGLDDAAKSQNDFTWPPVLELIKHVFSNISERVSESDLTFADGSSGLVKARASS